MNTVEKIIKDGSLTYEQKVIALAREAENSLKVLKISDKCEKLRQSGVICDLFEGNAPYRPRYIVPDYEKFMREGSAFLELDPPKDIWEATNSLLILYKHVPSITTMPVYIGNIDYLLEPFINDEEEAYKAIKLFLKHIDRTITDSFCHGNIGPKATKAGRLILKAERELQDAIPNITLKYSKSTPRDFAKDAVRTALSTAKPSFANDEIFRKDFNGDYAIASCYNGLYIGGGSYTLVRMNLKALAESANSIDDFFNDKLPSAMKEMAGYIDERIKYVVEESGFFENSFLIKEGLIYRDRFTAMFGMFGLAECVNTLLKADKLEERFGHCDKADKLGVKVIKAMDEFVKNHKNKYCQITNGSFLLHAQVGISDDINVSPGCRIPIGEEIELWDHLKNAALFHKYFPSGIGDIFPFEKNSNNNLDYILDIINGAFKEGMRYFSLYSSDSDVIRITGYLVKRSEIEKLDRGEAAIQDTVALGLGAVKNGHVLQRKVR
ncbi:YjjI family glycine radical enzyme [Clostridium fallax]|uniref:Glycine radical enzyme, YjjI family n=1 Tax=Clostridium fallax TaxID=1533 RepID=A0A1M4TXQ1_9CLOT|nr:YjjI family glycine radical enzyme [Clostridium fallax]SHE49226.1 glycine radical enzyme, YjjI family [Clostridium fallax]SQB22341.1 putative cytoplasmic protein [Clostridium fallax]